MSFVCLDTNVLIWGIKRQASAAQAEMIPRTRRFLDSLHKQQIRAVVPAVVVAELLMPLPLEEHNNFVADMSQQFIVPPFDSLVASFLAKVWQAKKGQRDIQRNEIKYDSMVIATALALKASCIYSHDPNLRTVADGLIECRDIPETPEQLMLI